MSEVNAPNCGRKNDLIGHLYGELNEVEARSFQRHLNECATCNTELASFGMVRESVVTWRNESIGNIGLPVQTTTSSPTRAAQAGPSAIAALREFFSLAPLWMKGAVAFAAVLFCVFAGLALARLKNPPPVALINPQTPPVHSQQEFNALVDQRVQEELNRRAQEPPPKGLLANDSGQQKNPLKRIVNRSNAFAPNYSQSARRPLSKTEREQLAADLRLVASRGDSDIDLLEDRINQ
jgi:anti-sigma factor RsiW